MITSKPLIFNTGCEGQGVAKMGYLELENQQGCEPFEGSNPSLSAKSITQGDCVSFFLKGYICNDKVFKIVYMLYNWVLLINAIHI